MHALIVMSDTGGGHRALSRAVAEALADREGHASIVDPFVAATGSVVSLFPRLYSSVIRRAPRLYGLVFDVSDAPQKYEFARRAVDRPVASRLVEMLAVNRADVVVFAHALAVATGLDAVDAAANTGGSRPSTAAMVTELATVHWSWIDPRVDLYLAASEEVVAALETRGVPASRIVRTGLPVGRAFGQIADSPVDLRMRLGYSPDRVTALVLAGGEGSGPVERIVPALARAMPDLQVIVVCGRNDRLRGRLEGYGLPPTFHILGFTTEMASLMHLADFVLTKGGPQSVAETLASGRPAVVTDLLPGQERGNGAYVVRRGAGLLALTLPDVLAATRRLATDPCFRARLARGAADLRGGEAAGHVASELSHLATSRPGPAR